MLSGALKLRPLVWYKLKKWAAERNLTAPKHFLAFARAAEAYLAAA
jgi:hypothetical protein